MARPRWLARPPVAVRGPPALFSLPRERAAARALVATPVTTRAPRLTEAQWQETVCELAELLGWSWAHAERVTVIRPRRNGPPVTYTETPLKGPLGRGFPDLILARDRVIFVELKADDGRMSPDQQRIRDLLRDAGAEWYVWTPRDLDEAKAVLAR